MKLFRAFLMSCAGLLLASCSDIDVLMPPGPQGPSGLSAYEVWVDAVNNGDIDWPKDRTDITNFFLYLKGEPGEDGLSAYEIWVEQVAAGIENPHKPGTDWPKDRTTVRDF